MVTWAAVAQAADADVEDVLARFANEPTVQEVQRWATNAVDASPEQLRRWVSGAHRAAWLPEVGLDLRVRDDWDRGFVYLGTDGSAPLPGIALAAVAEDSATTLAREVRLSLRWRLSELAVSTESVRLLGEARDLAELRDEVCAEVTRLYFERRRRQVEILLAPVSSVQQQVADRLALDELTASIDALTGGAFSRAMDRAADDG